MKLNKRLRKRHRYTQKVRDEKIFEADRIPFLKDWALCRYCWRPVNRFSNWVVAHEWPWSRWGPNALWNVGVSCAKCNQEHGAQPMTVVQSLSLRTKLTLAGIVFFSGLALVALF